MREIYYMVGHFGLLIMFGDDRRLSPCLLKSIIYGQFDDNSLDREICIRNGCVYSE